MLQEEIDFAGKAGILKVAWHKPVENQSSDCNTSPFCQIVTER